KTGEMRFIGNVPEPAREAPGLEIVRKQDGMVKDRNPPGLQQKPVRIESRSPEKNVVGFPLTRRTADVHQRGILAVNRRGLTIWIGVVLVGIKHLNFIQPHQINTAIASPLPFALYRKRSGPLHVKLDISKRAASIDISTSFGRFRVSVDYSPFCRASVLAAPLRQIFTIEKDHRV